MQVTVLAFAQMRDQLGFREKSVECAKTETPREVLRRIAPSVVIHDSIRVAVNREYADWDVPIGDAFELAVIPPVSGG